MRVLFHSYNTLGAGPAHVTKFMLTALARRKTGAQSMVIVPGIDLFADCKSTAHLKILRLPVFVGGVRYLFRGVYDLFILPLLSLFFNASAVIVLANYAPMPVKGKKIVFMRHQNHPQQLRRPGSHTCRNRFRWAPWASGPATGAPPCDPYRQRINPRV